VNAKNKIGVTYDQENFCACTTGVGPGPGGAVTSPEAGNDRRFPLQRFVTMDWSTPVSNKLLIEASGIHRVERWGGMEPQVGKLGNIDHLEPGMISVADTLNPVTGTPLTYRAAAMKDGGQRTTLEAAMAKLYSSEIAVRVAEDGVQIHGGYGFVKDYVAEKYFRDVKLTTIGEGTSEIQRLVIARQLL